MHHCAQRINAARIQSKREIARLRRRVTACQAVARLTRSFGNINDRTAGAVREFAQLLVLEDTSHGPRTTYLAAVRNPNPALPSNPMLGGHAAAETHEPSER